MSSEVYFGSHQQLVMKTDARGEQSGIVGESNDSISSRSYRIPNLCMSSLGYPHLRAGLSST